MTLRGSYGKSFRAPGVTDLRQDPDTFGQFAYPVVDPQSPTGMSNIMVIRGNDPDLGPARAIGEGVLQGPDHPRPLGDEAGVAGQDEVAAARQGPHLRR